MSGSTIKSLVAITVTLFFVFIASCGEKGSTSTTVTLKASDFAGDWVGSWLNTTFGSTGDVIVKVTINEPSKTFTMVLDIDGPVFGGIDPPSVTISGTYTENSATFSTTGTVIGDISGTLDENGAINGVVTNIPVPGVTSMSFSGNVTTSTAILDYIITFSDGSSANGKLDLNK